jgi:hypothetical protein
LEAHGGYLSVLQAYETSILIRTAREALTQDGHDGDACSLCISRVPGKKVIRVAYDSPHTYGRRGARWYEHHHALARLLSSRFATRVHAYVLDPEEFESVVTYAAGRSVGGEALRYDEIDGAAEAADDAAFEAIKSRWPLGYLAQILGVSRDELVKLPRSPSLLLELDREAPGGQLAHILPPPAW